MQVNGSDGLNGMRNFLIIWREDVYSHIFYMSGI